MLSKRQILALGLSSSSLLACRETAPVSGSQLQIHNGVEIGAEHYPAVVLLMRVAGDTKSYCTGVFINEFQALTAAHCVGSPDTDELFLMQASSAAAGPAYEVRSKAHAIHIHPDYAPGPAKLQTHDLALIDFPAGVADDHLELAQEPLAPNQEVTLVGFGSAQMKPGLHAATTPDRKRLGTNVIRSIEGGMHTLFGLHQTAKVEAGKHVSSCAGDSGSPWLVDDKITSLTVGADMVTQSNGTYAPISYAVDLTSQSNQDFLSTWIDD